MPFVSLRILALGLVIVSGDVASAQGTLPPNRMQAVPADQTVRKMVEFFRDSDMRQNVSLVVGARAVGFVDGMRVGARIVAGELGQPSRFSEKLETCFRGWTVIQYAEWLLQHWERTPEDWAEDWAVAAVRRIVERVRLDSQTC